MDLTVLPRDDRRRRDPLDHASRPKSIPSAKSRGVLQMREIPERMHVTHGSRRDIVQFQERCLLTGVRNSVRDRLDVPQRSSLSVAPTSFASRELPRLVETPYRSAAIKRQLTVGNIRQLTVSQTVI